MEKLSDLAVKTEKEIHELRLLKEQYKITSQLLYYAMNHEWVKEMVEEANIDFKMDELCSKEEIQDYINYIKNFERRTDLAKLLYKLDDPMDQAIIVSEMMKLKG